MEHEIGEVLNGRYELRGVLARGASTVTYAALDRTHDRKVGVRQWPDAGAQAEEELQRALAIGKRVAHMHLPRHVDHFALERGRGRALYLVHDAGEGQPLLARRGRQEPELRSLALALLRLVAALHGQQVVHGRVRADELLQRSDGRVFLLGTASERDAGAGITGDLRGVGETVLSAHLGVLVESPIDRTALAKLPRGLRAWLERLLASGGAGGFTSANEALLALQAAPSGHRSGALVGAVVGALVLAGTTAAGFYVMRNAEAFVKRVGAKRVREQGQAIADTSFEPKKASETGALQLERVASMAGHWSAVMDVAFDASGERVASASYDGSARLWQARDGAPLASFPHGGKVGAVAFQPAAPDGAWAERVLTGGGTTLRVWEASGQQVRSHEADRAQVTNIASTRDGKRLAAIGFDGKISVFDGGSGALLRSMQQAPRGLALAIDPGGTRVASGGDDGVVRVFELESGALLNELRGHTRAIDALVFSSDGNTLASASDDHSVRVWYLPAQKLMHELHGHADEVWALAIDPAGKLLASGSKDGELRLWDAYTGKLQLEWDFDERGICALAFSPDGSRLAIGGGSQRVDVYRLVVQRPSWRPPPVTAPVAKLAPLAPPKDASPAQALVFRAHELIEAYNGGSELEQAERLLADALRLDPKLALAYVERARVLYKRAHIIRSEYRPEGLAAAREQLRQALRLEPDLFDAHLRMGYLEQIAKNYPAARAAGERCEQIRPGDAETQTLYMHIASDQKEDEQVVLHARALIEGSPTRDQLSEAYSELRRVYERRGEYDAAEEAYRSQINLDPESAWVKGGFAEYLNRRGKYDDAITWARAAIAQMNHRAAHMTLAEAYAGKAEVALEQGQRDDCERWLAKAFEVDPRNAEAHYVRALALRRDKDEAGARRELEAALASDPEHRAAAEALGR